jgi:hypothetical protein
LYRRIRDGPEGECQDAPFRYYAARVQRHALGFLFGTLALVFVGIALAALAGAGHSPKGWVVAVASLALAAWLGSLAVSAFRSR